MLMRMSVFWDMTDVYWYFNTNVSEEQFASMFMVMQEVLLVSLYHSVQCHMPKTKMFSLEILSWQKVHSVNFKLG
jgi:hypothetical protein